MGDTVIKVENLSKRYRLGQYEKEDTFAGHLKNTLLYPFKNFKRIAGLNKFKNETEDPSIFWALQDINFEVKQGEVLGIIGNNGAGKSTLLKLLSKITEPTTGKIEMHGRVSALLEVGTGFHPELTGRDNVYMNGTILGMSKREIDAKFEEIVEFAGVAKHIDTPVKFYSSGMTVRLGFSVAAHLEPEILIIDEVLAVGDFEFQKKCLGKMDEVANSGRTVLFVSHNMASVNSLCSRAILLKNGKLSLDSDTTTVVDKYMEIGDANRVSEFVNSDDTNYGFFIRSARLLNLENGMPIYGLDDEISLEVEYEVKEEVVGGVVTLELSDAKNNTIYLSFDSDQSPELLEKRSKGLYKGKLVLPCRILKPGDYYISIGTGIANQRKLSYFENCLGFEIASKEIHNSFLSYDSRRVGVIRSCVQWKLLS